MVRRWLLLAMTTSMAVTLPLSHNLSHTLSNPASGVHAQEFSSVQVAMEQANSILGDGGVAGADARALQEVRAILDAIVANFPASDHAVKILFQDTVDGVDVALLDARLSEFGSTDPNAPGGDAQVQVEIDAAADAQETEQPKAEAADPQEPAADPEVAEVSSEPAPEPEPTPTPEPSVVAFSSRGIDPSVLELAEELHNCFVRLPSSGGSARQTLIFGIASDGQLDGLPKLKGGQDLQGADRRTYLNGLIAIEDCGPYPPRYAGRKYEVEFDGSSLVGLVDLSTVEPPWKEASKADFTALKLPRKEIAEIQARLEAIGIDPNGVDGAFGNGTRGAITSWQRANQIPASGYFDARQLARFKDDTATLFRVWLNNSANKARLEKAGKPRTTTTTTRRGGWYRDRRGLYCRKLAIGTWCQVARPRQ